MLEITNINTFYGQNSGPLGCYDKYQRSRNRGPGRGQRSRQIHPIKHHLRHHPTHLGQSSHLWEKELKDLPAHQIVEMGLAHIPEGGRAFPDMSVMENLEMGAYPQRAWKYKSETLNEVFSFSPD